VPAGPSWDGMWEIAISAALIHDLIYPFRNQVLKVLAFAMRVSGLVQNPLVVEVSGRRRLSGLLDEKGRVGSRIGNKGNYTAWSGTW